MKSAGIDEAQPVIQVKYQIRGGLSFTLTRDEYGSYALEIKTRKTFGTFPCRHLPLVRNIMSKMKGRSDVRGLLLNALRCRCPNCRQGKVFRGWPNRVLPRCPSCGLSYFRESGYYLGGMIITYILTAFIIVVLYLVSLVLPAANNFSENFTYAFWAILAISLTLVLTRPAYSLWLALDFLIDPWTPDQPK